MQEWKNTHPTRASHSNIHYSSFAFIYLLQCYVKSIQDELRKQTFHYLSTTFLNNASLFYEGMLPFHYACWVGVAPQELEVLLDIYPNAIDMVTTNTLDTPLHCYLLADRKKFVNMKGVNFLLKKQQQATYYWLLTLMDGCLYILQLFMISLLMFCSDYWPFLLSASFHINKIEINYHCIILLLYKKYW